MPKEGQRTRSSRWSHDHPGRRGNPEARAKGFRDQPFQGQKQRPALGWTRGILMDNVAKEMEHLHKLAVANQEKRFQDLWGLITSETWLAQAWEEIRRNKGSQTPGIDRLTAEDIDLPRIRRLLERLRNGTYRPKSVRRVYIPKSNGKLRPLGIPSIEDRIVQQGLRMVLEPIFEADFLRSSHGFRQGHSPHTALRDVARMYPRVSWVIEGDIVGCFDLAS